jgi:hypothetical protein
MYIWDLPLEKLEGLTLATDVRLGRVDYCNDQIWELRLVKGDPACLALYTTFGLRARGFQMFPQFIEGGTNVSDPVAFEQPPIVKWAYPNFARLTYAPLREIEVVAEYWVPDSHSIAGRLRVSNRGTIARPIRLEWVALLTPGQEGRSMAAKKIQGVWALAGESEGLAPVVFIQGGAEAGNIPYPALYLPVTIQPSESHDFIWSQVALDSWEHSFDLARQIASKNWEAERARLQMSNAGQVEIETGDPEWNTAFALTQQIAQGLLVSADPGAGVGSRLPNPSLIFTRQPDQGYSRRCDGSDYSHLWAGVSPLEIYYYANLLMPGAATQVRGLLRNFLAIQERETGFIDWKPGPVGQRSHILATPLLASLAWKYYQITQDKAFLEEIFDGLFHFILSWFDPQHDQDGDGIPEWQDSRQFCFEYHPVFDRWQAWSQGADIAKAESPALNAFLYHEIQALIHMAGVVGRIDSILVLPPLGKKLAAVVVETWDAKACTYRNRDRDAHGSPRGIVLGQHQGSGEIILKLRFTQPVRLVFRVNTDEEGMLHPQITILGKDSAGRKCVETISAYAWQWFFQGGSATGELTYTRVERVKIDNVPASVRITIASVNYQQEDLSLLLPIWAGLPEKEQAQSLVEATVTDTRRYWLNYGLPLWPEAKEPVGHSVCLPLNILVGEGLLEYGYRAEATELVTRLMAAVTHSLRQDRCFRWYYNAETGQGIGERNALVGLAPMGLFLETLGVTLMSPWRVGLVGKNLFPWPVRIHYRGLNIYREADRTIITFPDEQAVTVTDPAPCVVSMENIHG